MGLFKVQSSSFTNGQWKWLWNHWSLQRAHRCLLNSGPASLEWFSMNVCVLFVSRVSCRSVVDSHIYANEWLDLEQSWSLSTAPIQWQDCGCKWPLCGSQGLSEREHSCMRAWFTWINKLWFGPALTKKKKKRSSVPPPRLCEGSKKKKSVSNGGFGCTQRAGHMICCSVFP